MALAHRGSRHRRAVCIATALAINLLLGGCSQTGSVTQPVPADVDREALATCIVEQLPGLARGDATLWPASAPQRNANSRTVSWRRIAQNEIGFEVEATAETSSLQMTLIGTGPYFTRVEGFEQRLAQLGELGSRCLALMPALGPPKAPTDDR